MCFIAELETQVFNGLNEENVEGEISPIHKGTSTSITMSIEGKNSCSYDKLTQHLFANMVMDLVAKFLGILQKYGKTNVIAIDTIAAGYGIAYTGFGDVGF